MTYDCIIIGGGIAGLQAAIQLGRYAMHNVLVIDSGYGRSTLCRSYHNILGWPEGVSGDTLREKGRQQAQSTGVQFADDTVTGAEKTKTGFRLTGKNGQTCEARTLLLAMGLLDRFPDVPGLVPTLGQTVYVCPDCDGYEVRNRRTAVLGAGEVGAKMAFTLYDQTKDLVYVNHEKKPVQAQTMDRLRELGIEYIESAIIRVETTGDGQIAEVALENGAAVKVERGFLAFGGNEVKSELAKQLGVERLENKHVLADPRSKMTNVADVWAAGDLGAHAEQVTVAMGDGATAAIWINKRLCALRGEA